MTDHEQMMVSAERYALGRRTYIVSDTVNYIARHIDGMSEHCRQILIKDIKECTDYGDACDKSDWLGLLNKLDNITLMCMDTKKPCSECIPYCDSKYCMQTDLKMANL